MAKTPTTQAGSRTRDTAPQAAPSRKTKPAETRAVAKTPKTAGTKKSTKPTRADTLIGLMRKDGGATAQVLAKAVGWQVHSVRGFISGTLKKRADLEVLASRADGATRYSVRDRAAGKR